MSVDAAVEKFRKLVTEQIARAERMKKGEDWLDFDRLSPIRIGICMGDGIGPVIAKQALRVLEQVLKNEKKIVFELIDGLTIENRVKQMAPIPADVLEKLKACHVILKGPTTTPQKGDPWPNIESANVAMRRELDLFGNVRPVKVAAEGIDWTFFRENTEGAYVLGSKGFEVNDDVCFDFTVATKQGTERIMRLAFEFARKNNKKRVTLVTKSNVVKTTDGMFSAIGRQIAKDYPAIEVDEYYIDIMTAKLLETDRRNEFQVLVLPNLYGDILTDEAGQIQGGVGTAGSANIGKRWAMFEAIHGSAPRMVKEGRAEYADPSSMIKASAMLLRHIGYGGKADQVESALEACTSKKTRDTTAREFTDYVLGFLLNAA